jgi:hypothetical protein
MIDFDYFLNVCLKLCVGLFAFMMLSVMAIVLFVAIREVIAERKRRNVHSEQEHGE